jgi:hypothetical protein
MRRSHLLPIPIALAALVACGGDLGPVPADPSDGSRLAAQFEDLADQLGDSGTSATGNALRHAAQLVRLVGHATPVAVTIDGQRRDWLAVAEQLEYPVIECTWPASGGPGEGDGSAGGGGGTVPPDSAVGGGGGSPGEPECAETGTNSMRSIIAWEPEHMAEVVRMTAEPGSSEVKPGVPDVMAGLPTPSAPSESGDTAVTGGGTYGFMGEYLKQDDSIFWTIEGSQTNSREGGTGACTESHTRFDWAEFDCEAVRLRFEVEMRVQGGRYEPLMGRPGPEASSAPETHEISLPAATVDGAALKVVSWTVPTPGPEPDPGPEPEPVPPVDSTAGVSSSGR